jgi:hypothetical protein
MLPPKQEGEAAFGQAQAGPGRGSLFTIHRQALDGCAMTDNVDPGTRGQLASAARARRRYRGGRSGVRWEMSVLLRGMVPVMSWRHPG